MRKENLMEVRNMKRGILTLILVSFLVLAGGGTALGVVSYTDEYQWDTSENLTTRAWQALDAKVYDKAKEWAKICIFFWEGYAQKPTDFMTSGYITDLYSTRWAYSDVAACIFIKGEALLNRTGTEPVNTTDSIAEYKKLCEWELVHGDYEYAQISKNLGTQNPATASIATWSWKVASIAKLRLNNWMGSGDPEVLIIAAWNALKAKNFQVADTRAQDVISNFDGLVTAAHKDKADDFYLTPGTNTVADLFNMDTGAGIYSHIATAYFIKGEANRRGWAKGETWGSDKKTAAINAYNVIKEGGTGQYPYGLCANATLTPNNPTLALISINTWKVSEAAKKRLELGGGTANWDNPAVKAMLQY